jgi:xanthine dehydrogenase YagS FAD-binding subunit
MKAFSHTNAKTLAEASAALASGQAEIIAGGTDLIGRLKDNIQPTYPTALINIKTIPGLDYIKEEGGVLEIGATTRLADIAAHPVIKQKYTALAQAAVRVATPNVREMGTIGGNINQQHRCWYFRKPEVRFDDCVRKGGKTCYAMMGDHRYHSIFGMENKCFAVHPSDIAPALIALNATIVTTNRQIKAEEFWAVKNPESTVLVPGEIVTAIQVPAPPAGAKSAFLKFAIRKSIDFPIVNCAVLVGGGAPRIALNAVAPRPYRATKAEAAIAGKAINEETAAAAGAAAVEDAIPLNSNNYKVQIARTLVKRALLASA